jgi:hypothetical protein
MKQLTKYNRIAGYLNGIYDRLNADFFGGEMERPVITIQSTPKAYGHFTLYDAWTVNDKGMREINVGAGTLARSIENVIATLLHEMAHQYNALKNIKDVSRGGTYHNKFFKQTAEDHGLTISRDEKYGWTITNPSEKLIDWILENDLTDIPMNRNEFSGFFIGGNDGRADGGEAEPPKGKGSYRRYVCPVCGLIARTTKNAKLLCGDCEVEMEGA